MTVQFPMMRLKLPGGGGMSVTPYPTLKFNLLVPASIKLQFLPAIPGSNIHGKVNRSGDTMGGSLILDHDPLVPLEAATKQYVDLVGASGVSPGDKGDITVGGGGGWTIDNDVVTYAKMQNVSAAGRLLGRGSAGGAGDPEEIILGTNLSMSGTTLNATGGGGGIATTPPTTDNAIVRWDGATGTLIQNSGATISDDGRLDLRPTEETLTQGINIRNVPVGDQAGFTTYCNRVLIAADKSDGSDIGSNLVGFGVDHIVGPAIYTGNAGPRAAGSFTLDRKAPSTGGSGQDVGLAMSFTSNASGTIGAGPGKNTAYAGYSSASLTSGATNWSVLQSFQQGIAVHSGASAEIVICNRFGHDPFHAVKGSFYDSCIDFVDDGAATVGWDALITIGCLGGNYPLATTGTVMRTLQGSPALGSNPQTFANGIDFSDANITGILIKGKGTVGLMGSTSGTVTIRTAAAAGTWDLTLPTTAGTPGYFLQTNGSGVTTWAAGGSGGSGDVVGPASATDNAIARYDSTTGKLIQNSLATVDDGGMVNATAFKIGADTVIQVLGTDLLIADPEGTGHVNLTLGDNTSPVNYYDQTTHIFRSRAGVNYGGFNAAGLLLAGSTSGLVTVKVAAVAGTWDLTLPTTGGTSGYFLQTNGSGVTTWAAAPGAGSGSPGGATTHVQFNNAGVFAGDDEFTYDSAGQITLGKAGGGSGAINLKGSTSGTVTVEPAPAAGTWTLRLPIDDGDAGEVLTTDGSGVTSWEAAAAGREVITSARTYFVNNVTGNDADDGLTTGNAFATIAKAIEACCDDTYWVFCSPAIELAKTGVNYDEKVVLRPWQGSPALQNGTAFIFSSDTSDPSYGTGVLIRPTADGPCDYAAVTVKGVGARWTVVAISVDASQNGTNQMGCYAAIDGSYLFIYGGDLGPVSDPAAVIMAQLTAKDQSQIFWNTDFTNQHIYGVPSSGQQALALAAYDSSVLINAQMEFDNDPGYTVVLWAEVNSNVQTYHNCTTAGAAVTGQRVHLRDNSHGFTRLSLADFPGDSWTSYTSVFGPVQSGNSFNFDGHSPVNTVAGLASATAIEGAIANVYDSDTNVVGAVAGGGGAHRVPLWFDGTDWVVLAPVTGGGGGGSVTVDVLADILASTPTSGAMALATDADQMLIADGTTWHMGSSYFTAEAEEPDLGWATSNRIGYGRDYVSDKVIANSSIGYGSFDTTAPDGGIRFNSDTGAFGAFELFSEGDWHPVVAGLVLTEQDDMSQAITQQPIGLTSEIIVFNGDSVLRGLNDVPFIQGYIACLGAYPPLQRVTGGTF